MANIMIVEDNDAMRSFLAEALERSGHDVCAAQDAEAAAPLFSTHGFDLLLADVELPGEDGVSLARRAVRHRPDLRVMFVTGYAAKVARATDLIANNMRVLTKPFVLSDLTRQVGEMLKSTTPKSDRHHLSGTSTPSA